MRASGLAKVQRPLDIGVDEAVGRTIRVRNRNQRRQVKHDVDTLEEFAAQVRVTNVAGDDIQLSEARQPFQPARVVEGIVLSKRPDTAADRHEALDQM